METKPVLFAAKDIVKKYPGTTALDGIELEVRQGEVIGLVGENGAGKSTLLKIIMGIEQPTEGTMTMRRQAYAPRTPIEANLLGVGMVFQEQSLIQNLTVGQNIFFGQEAPYSRFGFVDKGRMYADTAQILREIGIDHIRPDRKISNLDFATRQMVEALNAGILSIPKERREEGIISDSPIYENISMSNYRAFKRGGLISTKLEKDNARKYVAELSIKTPGVNQDVGFLSGGNAQKVVFARILSSDADVLILNHPTRGVDVGAKEEIYSLIRDITASGKGMILLGDTLDECINLASRILVMKDGQITKEFDAPVGAKPDQLDIVRYMV
jgi:ABC-type sugar transport system, ATPase component